MSEPVQEDLSSFNSVYVKDVNISDPSLNRSFEESEFQFTCVLDYDTADSMRYYSDDADQSHGSGGHGSIFRGMFINFVYCFFRVLSTNKQFFFHL